jgi:hypothetical protein
MRDPNTPQVFVSYSRTDRLQSASARRLQALVETEGLSLYRDLNDLEGGEDWWRQLEAAIRRGRACRAGAVARRVALRLRRAW